MKNRTHYWLEQYLFHICSKELPELQQKIKSMMIKVLA